MSHRTIWTDAELWKVARCAKAYQNQWNLIQLIEFPDKTARSVYGVSIRLTAGWKPPPGTEKLPLRIEESPDEVRDIIASKLTDRHNRSFMPEVLIRLKPPEAEGVDTGKLLRRLQKFPASVETLADEFDVSPKKIREAAEALQQQHRLLDEKGGLLTIGELEPKRFRSTIPVETHTSGEWIRFGAIGDSHLGSKWERLDVLNALYDIYEREGIQTVYHSGNIVEGESRFNKFDIKVHGIEAQTQYCVAHYPSRKDIVTKYITADDHEGWWVQREGINWGKYFEEAAKRAGRNDLVYLDHVEHDVIFEHADSGTKKIMRIFHPGGGSAYALSYTVQKIVESYTGGDKPHILVVGHFHKFDNCVPRGVYCLQTGTTQDQSRFMRKKRLEAHVGGCILEFKIGNAGEILRFRQEWIPFYDTGFYETKYEVFTGF